jgi:hypothetical protein
MFVRLTRPARAWAGWFAALLYLFCVLAPGAALALGDAASCLGHQFGMATAAHGHEAAPPQPAASHQHHAMQVDQPATDHADAGGFTHDRARHQHGGKGSIGPCCAMLCVSAITADPPAVAKPSPPISLCLSEDFQRLPGEAPPLLYRPPIA